MSKITSILQAILLTLSLIFISIFIYLFVTHVNLIIPIQKQNGGSSADSRRTLNIPKDQFHHQHVHESDSSNKPTSSKDENSRDANSNEDANSNSGANSKSGANSNNEIIIETKLGKIKGFNQKIFDQTISTFLGVPYASPPVGSLRFKRTAPLLNKWSGTLDCTKLKPKCPQIELDKVSFTDVGPGMSEDCLYLNIWAPMKETPTSDAHNLRKHMRKRDADEDYSDEDEDDTNKENNGKSDANERDANERDANLRDANKRNANERDANKRNATSDDSKSGAKTASKLKPVMIWIYGGGFFMGSSNYDETDGRVLSSVGDVVIVTFEYRVGALGFIDLGTDKESGNQGSFDQITVMKWVKENIRYFGGDPSLVTLFGESSGAISIGLHLMSPESGDLVQRVILQSGSPMMTTGFFTRAEHSVPEFVKALQCLGDGSESEEREYDIKCARKMCLGDESEGESEDGSEGESEEREYDINCLRTKSIEEILNATGAMHDKYFFAFPPNVDDLFISTVPTEVVKREDKEEIFQHVKDILIGNNAHAFSYMLWLADRDIFTKDGVTIKIEKVEDVKKIMTDEIGHLLQMPPFQIGFLTGKLFANLSTANSSHANLSGPKNVHLDKMIQVLGDVSFVCPSKVLADEMAALKKNVHTYVFTHQISRAKDKWGEWFGATLHDEIPLVFGHPLRYPLRYSGKDIEMSKRLMRTWSHFARTGQLTDQLGLRWPRYEPKNRVFMELNADSASIGRNYHEETCETFKLGFDLLN